MNLVNPVDVEIVEQLLDALKKLVIECPSGVIPLPDRRKPIPITPTLYWPSPTTTMWVGKHLVLADGETKEDEWVTIHAPYVKESAKAILEDCADEADILYAFAVLRFLPRYVEALIARHNKETVTIPRPPKRPSGDTVGLLAGERGIYLLAAG